jgi:hypothetical protein
VTGILLYHCSGQVEVRPKQAAFDLHTIPLTIGADRAM